jgi:hypothetical protein
MSCMVSERSLQRYYVHSTKKKSLGHHISRMVFFQNIDYLATKTVSYTNVRGFIEDDDIDDDDDGELGLVLL